MFSFVVRRFAVAVALVVAVNVAPLVDARVLGPQDTPGGLILRGTVVTMDGRHSVIEDGRVLVKGDRIVAVWQGAIPPSGVQLIDATVVDAGPSALIFPGMINLHNHPTYDVLRLWPAPTSDVQVTLGRPLGTEPYANRYQWNGEFASSPEYKRLVETPQTVLNLGKYLNLEVELIKYAKVLALVGGETSIEGARPDTNADGMLARNVESKNFGRERIQARVASIASSSGPDPTYIVGEMKANMLDAWIVHLAEGVRDGDRRSGDTFSSRDEFRLLKQDNLLTDMTVIVHGIALERQDFAAMRAAPSIRTDGSGDRLGAKLVWSPLSNLLLYGKTANVYEALAEHVIVALGTDWTPSGSRNLLGELKVADIALRDPALLGGSRALVPEVSTTGKTGEALAQAERALDRALVDMVTRNPAMAVRWQDQAGSIEAGKVADLFVITIPNGSPTRGLPGSPYRSLIDATERDVQLVVVGGDPLVGDVGIMQRLKPGQYEIIQSSCGCYQKAISVTKDGATQGEETLAYIEGVLDAGLIALGGDRPPSGGGPADVTNTYSYLSQHFTPSNPIMDAWFLESVLIQIVGRTGDGKPNLERLTRAPLLEGDDELFFDLVGARINRATGMLDDATPPFKLYRSNVNQSQAGKDPFAPDAFENRWYPVRQANDTRAPCIAGASVCLRR